MKAHLCGVKMQEGCHGEKRSLALKSFLAWLVDALIAGVLGVIVGALVDPRANHLIIPAFQGLKKRFGRTPAA